MVKCSRRGFTLLELMLALALSVLVAGLLSGMVGLYSSAYATRADDIRRVALARKVLEMVAEDLRSTVTEQKFDASVMQQMLTGQAGGQAGGGQASGGMPSGTDATAGAGAAGTSGSSSLASSAADSTANTDAAATDPSTAPVNTSLPLGLYGSATTLTLDISRLPRPDEYIAIQTGMLTGVLNDIPGDIKSVAYWVQLPSNMGVADTLNSVTSTPNEAGSSGGLVRRVLDRAVVAHAEEMGQTDQLNRTGDLVAPEVLSLEFMYFDGTQWLTSWDSSTQGLPWLIEINLAMQSKTGEKFGIISPGISLATMPLDQRTAYGIEVYTLTVAIPGAQLQASMTDAAAGTGTGSDTGMSSMGL